MAKAAVKAEVEEPKSTTPSMKTVVMVALVLGLVGAGAGFALGFVSFTSENDKAAEAKTKDAADKLTPPAQREGAAEAAKPDAKHGETAAQTESVWTEAKPTTADAHGAPAEPAPDGGHGEADSAEAGNGPAAITLDPVVINIAAPSDVWIRLEVVLKASAPVSKDVTDQIHQDYLAFFRTMRLQDLEGASAFIDMKAELIARANFRAEGKINSVYIKTFLFE